MPSGISTAVVVHAQYGVTTWTMPAANLPVITPGIWNSSETALAVVMPVVTPASLTFIILPGMLLLLRFSSFIP